MTFRQFALIALIAYILVVIAVLALGDSINVNGTALCAVATGNNYSKIELAVLFEFFFFVFVSFLLYWHERHI